MRMKKFKSIFLFVFAFIATDIVAQPLVRTHV